MDRARQRVHGLCVPFSGRRKIDLVDVNKADVALATLDAAYVAAVEFRDRIRLLVAWSGLEALFGVDQKISFRLSLYVTNFLKSGVDRYLEFEKLRRSYDDRSRVAHGAATKAKAANEYATYTRDILRACLAKCIETNSFPNTRELIF